MNFLLYCYGNHDMGMGHVYRMLNLADRLTDSNNTVVFCVPDWKEGLEKIRESGNKIIEIPHEKFEDVEYYTSVLLNSKYDSVIVDALNVPYHLMEMFRSKTDVLVSLDNTGEGRFFCDILFNILYRLPPQLTEPKVEMNSFEFLIINERFNDVNSREKLIEREVKKLLVTQGGSDTYGIVPKVIEDLKNTCSDIEIIILIGPAFMHFPELKKAMTESQSKITVLHNIKDTWELFYDMDLAITGGGMTAFELLCAGVPCISITQERKELETLDYLADLHAIVNLGLYQDLQNGETSDAIRKLVNDPQKRMELSRVGKRIVDGNGVQRIARLINTAIHN